MSDGAKQGSRGKAWLGAFGLSFAVYLIPLFNVHAGWIPLGVLWGGFTDPSVLTFAMAAGALLFQGLAFALLYWLLRATRWWRWLIAAARFRQWRRQPQGGWRPF